MKRSRLPVLLFGFCFAVLTMTACSSPTPVPTVQAVAIAPATATVALPTESPVPMSTDAPVPPTLTSTPTNTPTARPTITPTPTLTPEIVITSTLKSGWTLYELKASNFAIAVPPKWRQLDLSRGGLETGFEMAGELNPKFAPLLSNESTRTLLASGVRFYALDLTPKGLGASFPISVNVLKVDVGIALPLDSVASVTFAQMQVLADPAIPATHRRVTLSNIEAEEIKYGYKMEMGIGEPVMLVMTQYIIMDGTIEYVISMGAPRELSADYAPVFKEIGKSFRLLDKKPSANPAVAATSSATRPPAPTRTKPPAATPTDMPGPKYAAPVLLNPSNGFGYSCKESLSLEWSGPPSLAEDEWYVIESAKTDHPDQWYGITDWLKETALRLDPVRNRGGCNAIWWCPLGGGSEGAYYWRVRIVRGDKATHTIQAESSPPSEPGIINYHRIGNNIAEANVSCP